MWSRILTVGYEIEMSCGAWSKGVFVFYVRRPSRYIMHADTVVHLVKLILKIDHEQSYSNE